MLGAQPREHMERLCVCVCVSAFAAASHTHLVPGALAPGHVFLWVFLFFRSLLPPASFKSSQREREREMK